MSRVFDLYIYIFMLNNMLKNKNENRKQFQNKQ